jgi:hypothetical protein
MTAHVRRNPIVNLNWRGSDIVGGRSDDIGKQQRNPVLSFF